ncbi:MAG TPA: hypothetical protein VGK99_10075 [Acidobacteriota bacterium]|jgi:hypothetical protein
MNNMQSMNTIELVAWYAAVVGTIALILALAVIVRDRARVLVSGRTGYRVAGGGPYDATKDYILVTVANLSHQPRTIEKVGLRLRHGSNKDIVASDCLLKGPQQLAAEASHTWVIEQGNIAPDDIECLWATDQGGKEFRGKLASA